MDNTQPIQAQARQLLQAQPQGQPSAQPQGGLPVPPPGVALKLAQQAQNMPPIVLGTLIWRALQQHGQATGNLTKHFGGQTQPGLPL